MRFLTPVRSARTFISSGPGGARILVCGASDRRRAPPEGWSHLSYQPKLFPSGHKKRLGVADDTEPLRRSTSLRSVCHMRNRYDAGIFAGWPANWRSRICSSLRGWIIDNIGSLMSRCERLVTCSKEIDAVLVVGFAKNQKLLSSKHQRHSRAIVLTDLGNLLALHSLVGEGARTV